MDQIDVSALMLGIDSTARAEVQRAMNDIAESGDTGSDEGLVQMLREAISLLRGVTRSWTHAGAINALPMPPEEAEEHFAAITNRARSRFDDELIRNVDGETTRKAAPQLPPSDVPGVVVITLVVAAHRELADVRDVRNAGQLSTAFDALAALDPHDFVAMEVIWSPADDRDRATVSEVEEKYPELTRLEMGVA